MSQTLLPRSKPPEGTEHTVLWAGAQAARVSRPTTATHQLKSPPVSTLYHFYLLSLLPLREQRVFSLHHQVKKKQSMEEVIF